MLVMDKFPRQFFLVFVILKRPSLHNNVSQSVPDHPGKRVPNVHHNDDKQFLFSPYHVKYQVIPLQLSCSQDDRSLASRNRCHIWWLKKTVVYHSNGRHKSLPVLYSSTCL